MFLNRIDVVCIIIDVVCDSFCHWNVFWLLMLIAFV